MNAMSFLEAVRKNIILPEQKVNPTALFSDDEKRIILTPNITGWSKMQIFRREDDLNWYFHKDYKGEPTLFGSTTRFNLYLKGISGYCNGVSAIHRALKLYANPSLDVDSRSMKEDDVNFLNEDFLRKLGRDAWLDSSYMECNTSFFWWGINFVDKGNVERSILGCAENKCCFNYYGIRPVLPILTSKVQVDLDSMGRDGKWKLLNL